jgi:hypothetical protein
MELPFSLYKLPPLAYRKKLSSAIAVSLGNIPIYSPTKQARICLIQAYLQTFTLTSVGGKKNIRGFSPQANYTDRAIASGQRS